MTSKVAFYLFLLSLCSISVFAQKFNNPIVDSEVEFKEENGLVAIEAEYFYKQSKSDIRQWYRTSKMEQPKVGQDEDGPHCKGAGNNAYLEILPDKRVTHDDDFTPSVNFTNVGGEMAILHYKVNFENTGRYYVWVRAFSSGSEDNGLHVGIDGTWPESGQRLQWCEGKNNWRWESKQRTDEVHCGVPHLIYLDIETPGSHEITFSMREDGFEFDRFLLTNNKGYSPAGVGPGSKVVSGILPEPFPIVSENAELQTPFLRLVKKQVPKAKLLRSVNFPIEETNYYIDKNWLAINPDQHKDASATQKMNIESGKYDLIFVGVGENDGSASYTVSIGERELGTFVCPLSENSFEEGTKYMKLWKGVHIDQNDNITVKSKVGSADGKEWSRARWSGIALVKAGTGKEFIKAINGISSVENVPPPTEKH